MSFSNVSTPVEIKYIGEQPKTPKIVFTAEILATMKYIVDTVGDEVGWMGVVDKNEKGEYWIRDVYIPKQDVNGGTCELRPESLADLAHHMIDTGKEDDIMKVRLWGHSHVNMGVSPSGQDISQALSLFNDCQDYFIRVICNKAGLMSVAFYDGENKKIIENSPWYVHDGIDRKAIAEKYDKAIKDNVQKLVYNNKSSIYNNGYNRGEDEDLSLFAREVNNVGKVEKKRKAPTILKPFFRGK